MMVMFSVGRLLCIISGLAGFAAAADAYSV